MHFGTTAPTVTSALQGVIAVTALQAMVRMTHWEFTLYVTGSAGLIIGLLLIVTYRGRTVSGWIKHRRRYRRRPSRLAQLISSDDTAILWDHSRRLISILIEVTSKPFALNILDQTHEWSSRTVDLDLVRAELRQYDIPLHDITTTTIGYTYADQGALARVAFNTTGPINAITRGHTYLRVTLELEQASASIEAREIDSFADPRDSLTSGIARTIQIASARAHRAVTLQGFIARKLSRDEATGLHREFVALLGAEALTQEGSTHAGKSAPHLVGFTPAPKHDNEKTRSEWLRATTDVCATITRIAPVADNEDRIEQFYCNKVRRLDSVSLAEANQLRREYGQHAAIAVTALPLAVPPELTATPGRVVHVEDSCGVRLKPGGVGIYLGHSASGNERVWLDITVACAEPLWLFGPLEAAQLFLIRSASLGLRIDSRPADLAPLAHALRHSGVGAHDESDLTIGSLGDEVKSAAPVRLTWSTALNKQLPRYYIDATTAGVLKVHTPDDQMEVRWELNSAEAALLAESVAR